MKAITHSKQQGFTLVEIAIVMVIIGLLLGAVLKGQNLINSARVRSMADQNSSYQAAYYGFIDRYRAVPGDMDADAACAAIGSNNLTSCSGTTGTVGGDGNGNLSSGTTKEDYGEASALWAHLSAADFIVGDYIGGATDDNDGSYTANTIAPVNAFGGRVILWTTDSYESVPTATTRLGFVVGRSAPASVLAELDRKVDDGRPDQGVLRATTSGSGGDVNAREKACLSAAASDGSSPAGWDVSADSQDCNAVYLY